MESDVQKISADIAETVKLIQNPSTPAAERRRAHEMLDIFKDTSPFCAKCGFFLSTKNYPPTVRHCGLQLIDSYIKLHWNDIDLDQKLWIKNSIIQTIASGTESVIKEEVYIKDAVSRIVVEIIKREWPQHWPSLMEELHNLCIMGDQQTELVLLIFSRLADDIVQFQNVPDVRRREIYRTLCSNLSSLFDFFWETLSTKSEIYISNANTGTSNEYALQTCRVIQVTLETLSTFVEWVPISHIMKIPLLKLLSKLLEYENLRMSAVMCLVNIFDRKGKADERKELLIFFEETAIFKEISELDEATLLSEKHYEFLRELCKCFALLGTNLCTSMAQFSQTQNSIAEPQSFPLFLNCVLLFAKHPSVVLSQRAQVLWQNILRSPQLSTSPSVLNLIPTLLKYEAEKLFKVGHPSKSNSPACKFSLIEFDSDEDFDSSFTRLRVDVAEVLRLIANVQPQIAFSFGKMLLASLTAGRNWTDIIGSSCPGVEQKCYWEAMVVYLEAICSTLIKKDIVHSKEFAADAFEMNVMCRNLVCEDPVILSFSLSCISSLFFFYTFAPENCMEVIDKTFSYLSMFPKDGPYVKDVMNLRRHASALMIKLCCNHPTLLMPFFETICERIQSLFLNEDCLTQFDKCALLEALIILSNNFCDYEKQSGLLKHVLSSAIQTWTSPAITGAMKTPDVFISFLGINKPHHYSSTDSPISKEASDLMHALNVIRACVKRCCCPTDPEVAKKGNFIQPFNESNSTLINRNPAAQYILPLIENIIQLLMILNTLHDPLVKQSIDPSYLNVLNISEIERNIILGHSSSDSTSHQKTPCDRMKIYVQSLYEGCLFTLGNSVENLGMDFYSIPTIAHHMKLSVLFKIKYMPAFNLKNLIRLFLRPFFLHAPPTFHDELMLILQVFTPYMLQKLRGVWEKFKLRYGTSVGYEEQQTENEEILEDQLNRLLTREYIQFLSDLLCKQNNSSPNGDSMEDGNPAINQSNSLSDLGLKIMQTEAVRAVFICTAFDSLRWLDTTANLKALHLCEVLFNKIISDGQIAKIQEANYLLQSVLYGLQELGEHEANLALMLSFSITVYEMLRHRFPDIRITLMTSVACDENSIRRLDDILDKNCLKTKNDKMKRDAFKHVVSKIIGTNLGQHHKKEVLIKNLPPLISFKRRQNSSLLDVEVNDDIGICSLFAANGKS